MTVKPSMFSGGLVVGPCGKNWARAGRTVPRNTSRMATDAMAGLFIRDPLACGRRRVAGGNPACTRVARIGGDRAIGDSQEQWAREEQVTPHRAQVFSAEDPSYLARFGIE